MEPVLTYEKVKAFCQEKESRNEKVTLRSIVDSLGGSMSTAMKFKKQWDNQRFAIDLSGKSKISEKLQDAILAEIGDAIQQQSEDMKKQNSLLEDENHELTQELDKLTIEKEAICIELEKVKNDMQWLKNDSEKMQSVSHQRMTSLEENIQKLEIQLADEQKERIKALSEKSKIESRAEGLRELNQELKTELKEERDKNIQLIQQIAANKDPYR